MLETLAQTSHLQLRICLKELASYNINCKNNITFLGHCHMKNQLASTIEGQVWYLKGQHFKYNIAIQQSSCA